MRTPTDPLPVPGLERRRLLDHGDQRYWLGVPAALPAAAGTPILVCLHGISRNAGAHARAFWPAAQRAGWVLVAPHFARSQFPDYQRFGRPQRTGPGGRADHMLLRILAEVRMMLALEASPLYLFGHSGGAQFVLRWVLAYPRLAARYVASAPGAYVWPDAACAFPFGCGASPGFADLAPSIADFAATPGLLVVGREDVLAGATLRQGPRVQAVQGSTRVERAQRFVAALHRLDAGAQLSLMVLGGCGHAFSELVRKAALPELAMRHLAGQRPALNPECAPVAT